MSEIERRGASTKTRDEIFAHRERLWVLCLGREAVESRFTPLIDTVDWYNNQILAKSVCQGKIDLEKGSTALVSTSGLLPVDRLLVYGLGASDDLAPADAKSLAQDLGRVVQNLGEEAPWILLSGKVSRKFADEFEKSRTSTATLAQAKISLDL